jgi:V-type H+-transporting ATPase subunit H
MTTPLLFAAEEVAAAAEAPPAPPATDELLRRPGPPWEIYMTARLISDADLAALRRYDKRDPERRAALLAAGGAPYVAALLSVLRNVTRDETVRYALALLDDMVLSGGAGRAALLHDPELSSHSPGIPPGEVVYPALARLLERADWYAQETAAALLAAALAARPDKAGLARAAAEGGAAAAEPAAKGVAALLAWAAAQLRRPGHPARGPAAAAAALAALLREPPARALFARAGGAPLLAPLLRMPPPGAPVDAAALYAALVAAWELSYHRPAAAELAAPGALSGLVDVVRLAQKERLVRAALLALRNLLGEVGAGAGAPMRGHHLSPLEFAASETALARAAETRAAQAWDDEDVPLLLAWATARLAEGAAALSSVERLRREVASGRLRWGPRHEAGAAAEFWARHAPAALDEGGALLRALVALLEPGRDPTTLAVALRDVGALAAAGPGPRAAAAAAGAKDAAMRLLAHPSGEVQREALGAAQRLLLSAGAAEHLAQAAA